MVRAVHPFCSCVFKALFLWRQDSFYLLNVVEVVAGDHFDYVLDGLLAALGVLAEMFPLVGGQGFEQR